MSLPPLPPAVAEGPAPVVRTSLAPFTPEQVRRGTRLSPGEQPRTRGAGVVVGILGLLLVAAWRWWSG
ncbi:hypothetical protein ABXN37_13955 [Piscinibacter sakaiensis]|uniref:hypothetical protein n=1 Tax=Piscinibacter sakaiensis TaxID=1547922 RepID=UPI00372C98D2